MVTNYASELSIKLSTITVAVLDVGGNDVAYNASFSIIVDISSPDMDISGTLTASMASNGRIEFNNVSLNVPSGGLHALVFTSNPNSTIILLQSSITITISPGSPYSIRASIPYNSTLPCAYPSL